MKKLLIALLLLLILCSCGQVEEAEQQEDDNQEEIVEEPKEKKMFIETGVKQGEEFDDVFLTISIDDFLNSGFSYGDSINIYFTNGLTANDIPFYSGFYAKRGDPVVVGYEGYEYIILTRVNIGLWSVTGLTEEDTAKVELNEKGKYKIQEDTFTLKYSDDVKDYESKEQFANYRGIKGGKLKEFLIYRGASPVDNTRKRATIVNELIKRDGIKYVLNLAENKKEYDTLIKKKLSNSYVNKLFKKKNVLLLDMSADYSSKEYGESIIEGFRAMLEHDGPYYIHCLEGKDRTGFVCILLEALAGFSEKELEADYMVTFTNYFGITKEDNPEKYEAIKETYYDPIIDYLHPKGSATDYKEDACNYLRSFGMQEEEIQSLISLLVE